jgi:hypothetical protein
LAAGFWLLAVGSSSSRLNSGDLIGAKNLLQLLYDGTSRSLNLKDPAPIDRAYREHTVGQIDRRRTGDCLPDCQLPGEVRPLFRRRLSPNDFRQDAR